MNQECNAQKLPCSAAGFENAVRSMLGNSLDVVVDRFLTNYEEAVVVCIDGLVDKDLLNRDIIKPLKDNDFDGNFKKALKVALSEVRELAQVVYSVLNGNVAVYYAGFESVVVTDLRKWDMRPVDVPDAEGVVRGPKEGYTESILTNISMLRRKLRTPNLMIENIVLGRQTNTVVGIAYLKDIVNRQVLDNVKAKLNRIETDAVLESGYIEQYLEDNPFSIISGMGITQKPDVTAARILEGRVALLIDGTPHVLTVPELFVETLHGPEDYYSRTLYANIIRTIRFFALLVSVFLPGLLSAILTFDQEMIPFPFLINVIKSTEGTPFPLFYELLFLAVMFELLKEAGLRMPKAIGSAITIVGALILGDIAVTAGIVSAPSVIIIAIAAVASLLVINLNEFATIYRFLFLALGSVMGIVGIAAGIIIMLTQLIGKKSFGIPVLSSFGKQEIKDSFFQAPLKMQNYRPQSIAGKNKKRNSFGDGA